MCSNSNEDATQAIPMKFNTEIEGTDQSGVYARLRGTVCRGLHFDTMNFVPYSTILCTLFLAKPILFANIPIALTINNECNIGVS